jgi:hypothetical protein
MQYYRREQDAGWLFDSSSVIIEERLRSVKEGPEIDGARGEFRSAIQCCMPKLTVEGYSRREERLAARGLSGVRLSCQIGV